MSQLNNIIFKYTYFEEAKISQSSHFLTCLSTRQVFIDLFYKKSNHEIFKLDTKSISQTCLSNYNKKAIIVTMMLHLSWDVVGCE